MLVQALPMSPTGHVVVPRAVVDGQCRASCLVAACMVPAVRPSCSELPKGGVGARWHWAQHTTTPQQPPHTASTPRTRVLTSVSIWKGAGGETTACGAAASGLRDAAAVDLQLQQHTVLFCYAADDDWLPVWRLEPGCGGPCSACLLRRPDPTISNPTHSRPPPSTAMIEVIANDRLGTRVRIKAK